MQTTKEKRKLDARVTVRISSTDLTKIQMQGLRLTTELQKFVSELANKKQKTRKATK